MKLKKIGIGKIFLFIISIAIMLFLGYKAWSGIQEIIQSGTEINWVSLVFTLPTYLVVTINSSYIWADMAHTFDIPGTTRHHMVLYLSTLAARRLPGPYMNVVSRVGLYKQQGVDLRKTTFISGIEILMVIWTGLQVILLSNLLIALSNPQSLWILIIGLLLLTGLFHPRVISIIYKKISKEEKELPIRFGKLAFWWAEYIFQWALGTIFQLQLLSCIWPQVVSLFFPMMSAWSASGVAGILIGILPSGLGVSDVSFSVVFSQFVPLTIASLLALLSRAFFTCYDVLLSMFVILVFRPINPKELLFRERKKNIL